MSPPRYAELPPPSLVTLSPQPYPSAPPAFLVRALIGLRYGLMRLARKLGPADITLYEDTTRAAVLPLLNALMRSGALEALGQARRTFRELASAASLDADALERAMRFLHTQGYFQIDAQGRVAHNGLSRVLLGGTLSRAREFALYFASGSNMNAWAHVEHTLRTGQSPFDYVHGKNVWQWFEEHDDERVTFAHAMMGLTTAQAPAIAKIYPFSEVRTVCDIGGGRGTLLSELLLRHAHLRGVLCDSAGVLDSARELLVARGVLERVTLTPGSFFEHVPSGADAYILKNILHDWGDTDCVRILQVARAAMGKDARLLIAETPLEPGSADPLTRQSDVQMMVACSGGRERSVADYAVLAHRAGLEVTRTFRYPTISVIEAVLHA